MWDPTKIGTEYIESEIGPMIEQAKKMLDSEECPKIDTLEDIVMELDESEGPPILEVELEAKKMRRSFTVEQKLEALSFAKAHSKNAACREFKINRSTIRGWEKQERELITLQKSSSSTPKLKCRLPGGGRHLRDRYFDDQLAEWVRTQRASGNRVSRRTIQIQAQELMRVLSVTSNGDDEYLFKASKGWLDKFLARHKFRQRDQTDEKQRPRGRNNDENGYFSDESLD